MSVGEARVEHRPHPFPRRPFKTDHVLGSNQGLHEDRFERAFGHGASNRDLIRHVRIGDHEVLVAQGPEVNVKEIAELVFLADVLCVEVRMAILGELLDAVPADLEMTPDKVMRWAWLKA